MHFELLCIRFKARDESLQEVLLCLHVLMSCKTLNYHLAELFFSAR